MPEDELSQERLDDDGSPPLPGAIWPDSEARNSDFWMGDLQ